MIIVTKPTNVELEKLKNESSFDIKKIKDKFQEIVNAKVIKEETDEIKPREVEND